jgi:hypothetical protein
MRCQPARWKKVACGQARTKSSQARAGGSRRRQMLGTIVDTAIRDSSAGQGRTGRVQEDVVHAAPAEIGQQPLQQLAFHATGCSRSGGSACAGRCRHARLPGSISQGWK